MKIYNLAFLLLPLFFFVSNKASKAPITGTANIVFRSADGGQTWQDISNGLAEIQKDDDGISPNHFYTDNSGIFITDGNWIYHSTTNAKPPFWTKAVFPDKNANIAPGQNGIFAYNYNGPILQKPNGTNTWSPIFTDLHAKKVRTVAETAQGILFIGTDEGLFKSTDKGKTWKTVHAWGLPGKIVESDGIMLATSNKGIIRSTDNGENWELVISEGGVGIDVEKIKGGFAAINYSSAAGTRRVRTSYDGGKTWQPIDAGLQPQIAYDAPWQPINTAGPAQGNDSTWHPKGTTPPIQEYKTSIIQVGNSFFCGHSDGIYKTSDKGKTWQLILPAVRGKMFQLSVSGNVIYAVQMEDHC